MTKSQSDRVLGQSQLAALTARPKPRFEWKKFAAKRVHQMQRRENVGDHVALAGHDMTGPCKTAESIILICSRTSAVSRPVSAISVRRRTMSSTVIARSNWQM